MVFSSSEFIFGFLPIVLIGYYLLGKLFSSKVQKCFLVVASLYFYAYFKVEYLAILIASILINYMFFKLIFISKARHNLAIARERERERERGIFVKFCKAILGLVACLFNLF